MIKDGLNFDKIERETLTKKQARKKLEERFNEKDITIECVKDDINLWLAYSGTKFLGEQKWHTE